MTTAPQDHKPAYPANVDFETTKGKLTLPHFSRITGGALRKARKEEELIDQFFVLIEEFCGDPSPELDHLDSLPMTELGELFMEWTGKAPVGESAGS